MRIRCGTCHGSIWIQAAERSTDDAIVQCESCAQEYDLGPMLGSLDLDEFQGDAREFARNSGIDLPAAYSVLLGITSLETVQDLRDPKQTAPASGPSGPRRFDASFREAVEAGWLTPEQAALRRKREPFAQQLVEHHGLSMDVALQVADNRITLLEAVRQNGPTDRIEIQPEQNRVSVFRIVVVSTATILVLAALTAWLAVPGQGGGESQDPVERVSSRDSDRVIASLADVEIAVKHTSEGELSEVSGGDPEAVLTAFCRAKTGPRADPIGLQSAGGDWTGLYRENGELFSIAIRKDPGRNAWVAGNAVDRIRPEPLPDPPVEVQ